MNSATPLRPARTFVFGVFAVSVAFLAGCTSQSSSSNSMVSGKKRSKEYFAETEYGVKASPRVSNMRTRLPRGGGRDQLGKPYKVKGKWYTPREDKNYRKVGGASWYGDAFHGRLTANGEIYDMTHLTAAHPTMPLPSYARVTNMKNGASVIVRVNDRGPYANGRIIDLSKRAAQLLDYTHTGVAKVKVEYVGRAPLEGRDDRYLLASYRPNGVTPSADPSDGLATGVMVAMNGRTPSAGVGVAVASAFPGILKSRKPVNAPVEVYPATFEAEDTSGFGESGTGYPVLPAYGPVAPERPSQDLLFRETQTAFAVMSYADERVAKASDPFAAFDGAAMSADDVVAAWKRRNVSAEPVKSEPAMAYVAVGSFRSEAEAKAVAASLAAEGRAVVENASHDGKAWYSVSAYPDGRAPLDDLLEAAWDHGAPDALVVRD